MASSVKVAGVGMIPFTKPGKSDDYPTMGETAARLAIEDAGISYNDIGQAYVGYVYGDSTAGQAALYGLGLTGIPIVNVNNNCATCSTALFLARQAVALAQRRLGRAACIGTVTAGHEHALVRGGDQAWRATRTATHPAADAGLACSTRGDD